VAGLFRRIATLLRGRYLPVFYDPRFRFPISGLEAAAGIDPRRADFAAWYLRSAGGLGPRCFRTPRRATFDELARVHTTEHLESLARPESLAAIFGVDPSDIPADELLDTIRLATGATIEAARLALRIRRPALCLLGGFHHAGPASAGGFCAVNDVAVALAAVRTFGFRGRVVVLDLDAHPPDGIAACLGRDPRVWIGSLSGSDWGRLEGVDETVLPAGTGDEEYLVALHGLLRRMPRASLAFVIAGGDVLAGDRLGKLALTVAGARRRDLAVARALAGTASVWLPAGGYHEDAWRILAGTGLALASGSAAPIPEGYDPLSERYDALMRDLTPSELGESGEITAEEIEEALGLRPSGPRLLLGFYTASGIEQGLHRIGILDNLKRLGFRDFRVTVDTTGLGDRLRVFAAAAGQEHLLVEAILERRRLRGAEILFIHWLSLRNPVARFSERRPQLPGQEVPGLGLAREAGTLLARMAVRLGLAGVAFRPSHYHLAYTARHDFAFVDPARQGRFEAMVRDLGAIPLLEATHAVAEGRVALNGRPYTWEADEMAFWMRDVPLDDEDRLRELATSTFTLAPREAPAGPGGATPAGAA
jgi:acetoin utilization deacetylase AcuC-like enzyme